MKNLLQEYGHRVLLKGVTLNKYAEAMQMFDSIIKEHYFFEDMKEAAALAYFIGIKQGVHNERHRRKGGDVV